MNQPIQIQGSCIDLESAYKQCPVDPGDLKYAVFAVKNPADGKIEFYIARALPFGAKASVHGFNRASRAVNYLVHDYAGVTTGTHFDDFPMIAPKQLSKEMYKRMIHLITLLGWSIKKKPGSLEWPSDKFNCLGVVFEFRTDPVIVISNTSKRIENIKRIWEEITTKQMITGLEIASLRGKMKFSTAQCYGKIGTYAFHILNKYACEGKHRVDEDLKEAVTWWLDVVEKMPPRIIEGGKGRPPILIFSDGACEGEEKKVATHGAFVIDPEDGWVEAFGAEMCEPLQLLLTEGDLRKQVIGQAEILPMIAARIMWNSRLTKRDIIHYVDNDAARLSTIKGTSPSVGSAWMIHAFWETEVVNGTRSWISRVPTECNIGDGPSRNEWEEVKKLYPEYKEKVWTKIQEWNLLKRWGRS